MIGIPSVRAFILGMVSMSILGGCALTSTKNTHVASVLVADEARAAYVEHRHCGLAYAARALSAPRYVLDQEGNTDDAVRLWTALAVSAQNMGCPGDARAAYKQIITAFSGRSHTARSRAQDALDSMGPE